MNAAQRSKLGREVAKLVRRFTARVVAAFEAEIGAARVATRAKSRARRSALPSRVRRTAPVAVAPMSIVSVVSVSATPIDLDPEAVNLPDFDALIAATPRPHPCAQPQPRLVRIRRRRNRSDIGPRSRSTPTKQITREILHAGAVEYARELAVLDDLRPRTRADCLPGGVNEARPCPWVSCRHHLYLEVTEPGSIKIMRPDLEPHELAETCSLDRAEQGEATLEVVGALVNLTRERVRQDEVRALHKAHASASAVGIDETDATVEIPMSSLAVLMEIGS